MNINEKLIIALDVDNVSLAEEIVNDCGEDVTFYKVGLQLFTREGIKAVEMLKRKNKKVFLDLKLHDIPNTVINAVKVAYEMNIDILTIHSMGGFGVMEGVAKLIWQLKDGGNPVPAVVGVTLLTSLDGAFLEDIIGTTNRTIEEEVIILAKAVKSAGLDGVVASPKEIVAIRENCGNDFLIITPGIRPIGTEQQDQARIATPKDAIRDGADYIVVGRPVTEGDNKKQAVQNILNEMKEGMNERKAT